MRYIVESMIYFVCTSCMRFQCPKYYVKVWAKTDIVLLFTVEMKMSINKHESFDPGLPRLVAYQSNLPFVALQEF